MALEPITRKEKIIAGEDLQPITRLEKFLKEYGGSGGSGGGGSSDAVLYTAQTLTTEQKTQARDNIDASIADFVVNGTVNSDRTVTLDKTFAQIQEAVQGVKKDHVRLLLTMVGDTFVLPVVAISSNEITFQTELIGVDARLQAVNVSVTANGPALTFNIGISLDSSGSLPQHSMAADPTLPMQIATKQYVDSHAGGSGGWFVVTASADESGNIIVDHYRDDIATAFEKGEMPIVKATFDGTTQIFNLDEISNTVAEFFYVSLAGNTENSDVFLQQLHIGKEKVNVSVRNIAAV